MGAKSRDASTFIQKHGTTEEYSSPIETKQTVDLHTASANGNFHILKGSDISDIDMMNSNNETLLYLASANGHFHLAEYLLERGAQSNMRNSNGRTAFMAAAQSGHIDVIKILCRKSYNTDVNLYDYNGRTALHEASYKTAIFLLSLGDRIQVDAVDYEGNTPLHLTLSKVDMCFDAEYSIRQLKLATILLMNGANINGRNWKGRTPLIEASMRSKYEIVYFLLNPLYKADINIKDMAGKTALLHAVENTNFKTVELLVAAGADVNCYDLRGFTALHASAFYSGEKLFYAVLGDLVENKRQYMKYKLNRYYKFVRILFKNSKCILLSRDFRGRSARDLEGRMEQINGVRSLNDFKKIFHSFTDDRGNTVLHRVCLSGDNDIATLRELSRLLDNKVDLQEILNSTNDRGRTVLHHVAMRSNDRNSLVINRALLDAGAQAEIRDIYGRIANDYCKNQSFRELVSDEYHGEVMRVLNGEADQVINKKPLEMPFISGFEILRRLFDEENRHISKSPGTINLLKLVAPSSYSANFAFSIWQNGTFAYRNRESFSICEEVTKFVEKLLSFVADLEPLFEGRLILVGSARENTKINEPDEFDFDVTLVNLSKFCSIVRSSSVPRGFFQLTRKANYSIDREFNLLDNIFSKDGFLLVDEINSMFQVCIQRALEDRKFWQNENVFDLAEDNHYFEESAFSLPPRVCATLKLRAIRKIERKCVFKKISVDIVPCIHIDNWWPNYAIPVKKLEEFRNGCSLVFDQPQRKYPWIPYSAPYARISFAAMESQIIVDSPAAARAAYMVAKHIIQKPKHSYILKTCLLYCLEAFQEETEDKSCIEEVRESELNFWVRKLLKCYLLFCLQDFVPSYFMSDFHLPFTDYAKSNHDHLTILGVDGDNGLEILERVMESRKISKYYGQGYPAKICNIIDGIANAFSLYWSVCGERTEVEFSIPNPESSKQPFQREDLLEKLRTDA